MYVNTKIYVNAHKVVYFNLYLHIFTSSQSSGWETLFQVFCELGQIKQKMVVYIVKMLGLWNETGIGIKFFFSADSKKNNKVRLN